MPIFIRLCIRYLNICRREACCCVLHWRRQSVLRFEYDKIVAPVVQVLHQILGSFVLVLYLQSFVLEKGSFSSIWAYQSMYLVLTGRYFAKHSTAGSLVNCQFGHISIYSAVLWRILGRCNLIKQSPTQKRTCPGAVVPSTVFESCWTKVAPWKFFVQDRFWYVYIYHALPACSGSHP